MEESNSRSLALTPTWSVATVLTIFVAVSLLVERFIHRFSSWLKKTRRNPLFEALEIMKQELMLLGFISLLLTASSRLISNICIPSKFYNSRFSPCSSDEVEKHHPVEDSEEHHKKLLDSVVHASLRRLLNDVNQNSCKEGHEPFVSYEGLEQLHRFIFVMAITHVFYSGLTMLLAIVKIHTWRKWEEEARNDRYDYLPQVAKALTLRRQSTFVKNNTSKRLSRNRFLIWVTCFLRQFGIGVVRGDYLTLRMGFITNHNLPPRYDFHSYMLRSTEEEFKMIVGVSAPLWGFVVAFMLFNVNGSNLYFWIAIIPLTLILLMGAKLQSIIATLTLESVGVNGFFTGGKIKPRDELFWFKKPELLLNLIHFVLFQNAFELATFLWFWWQFGYDSCFIRDHWLVYVRLILGFICQFLCSFSTLPLYALVTQMGSNYKAALIPRRIRETMHGWGKAVRKRRKHRLSIDDSATIRTETSTVCSIEDDDQLLDSATVHSIEEDQKLLDEPCGDHYIDIELQPSSNSVANFDIEHQNQHGNSTTSSTHALLHSASMPSSPPQRNRISRSLSMPTWHHGQVNL